MREIKFRAMIVGSDGAWIATQGNHSEIDTLQKFIALYGDHELMQFTGLKDKNGTPIYEGDLIKKLHSPWGSQHLGTEEEKAMTLEEYLDSLTEIYEVVFSIDQFLAKKHIGYRPWDTDNEGYTHTSLIPDKHGYIQVIGNIYETPELLEEQNQ